jgi:hypothetical protein
LNIVRYCAAGIVIALLFSGCAAVKPWERGYLARPEMNPEGDAGETKLLQHTYVSKEAAFGGHAVGGGGCGCN